MVKKMSVTPRSAQGTAKPEVVLLVSVEAVRDRAYDLFQARGSAHGHDVDDWLVAETELHAGSATEIASPMAGTPRRAG